MHVDIDVKMHIHQFWWACPFRFRRYRYSQKRPIFPFRPWSSKNLIDRNRPKKFMHVDIDITCMYTNFGGRVLSGFGDKTTILPFRPWTIVHGHQKI